MLIFPGTTANAFLFEWPVGHALRSLLAKVQPLEMEDTLRSFVAHINTGTQISPASTHPLKVPPGVPEGLDDLFLINLRNILF